MLGSGDAEGAVLDFWCFLSCPHLCVNECERQGFAPAIALRKLSVCLLSNRQTFKPLRASGIVDMREWPR